MQAPPGEVGHTTTVMPGTLDDVLTPVLLGLAGLLVVGILLLQRRRRA